ncbi:MAG: PKD domain-containing protein [Vicinamibacterales bacterium]|jgi:PKD repeat protein
MRTSFVTATGALALTLLAGCTVKDVEPPSLAGPSTMATSINLLAQPDSILQDNSTSRITATVKGPDGRPISGLDLRAQMFVDGVAIDFGTLAPKSLRTGSDGTAVFVYTSPARPAESVGTGTRVTIAISPVGGDFRGEVSHEVDINVIPPGVILPPNGAPVAAFVVTPTPVTTNVALNFDASTSTDEGVACGARCTYSWVFGDGTSGAGINTTHTYRSAGTFNVVLSVADARGLTGTSSQALAVAAAAPPTAVMRISPTPAGVNQDVFFTAEESQPAAGTGRKIVNYGWNFGDGTSSSGISVAHRFSGIGTYQIALTVTDEIGSVGQAAQSLVVGAAGSAPTAVLTFLPATPRAGQTVAFDASASLPGTGATIVSYKFNYGDGTEETVTRSSQTHTYGGSGTVVASVTVTDSLGRTATKSVSVIVSP